jgi:eukaryotic-like serine/threonine-protein kinase
VLCPQCGTDTPVSGGECPTCRSPLPTFPTGVDLSGPAGVAATVATTAGATTASVGAAAAHGRTVQDRAASELGVLARGEQFGTRYHIISLLGIGGMGEVYRAWDDELGLAVALKIVRPEVAAEPLRAARLHRQFKDELVLARKVTHKNVVRIHDLGEIRGIKYITMPYVEGSDLATLLKKTGPLGVQRALTLARQITEGLRAAHDAKVVHRDLKPANIMVTAADEAIIMDFGIAQSTLVSGSGPAGVAGTPEYMAPEQASAGVVDQRADIYAFGLILYEMLAGRRAPSASGLNRIEAMQERFEQGLPALRTVNPEIPEPVDAIVARAIEIDLDRRYQTTAELAADLSRLDEQGEIIPEPRRVTPRLIAVAAALFIAVATATYVVGRRAVPVTVAHDPVPLLIADFDNRTGDRSLDGSIEQALGTALEAASYITIFSRSDARAIAAGLNDDKSSRIGDEVGRLIARREGLKVLVGGTIDGAAGKYKMEVRASDPATGKSIATVARSVSDKARLVPAIGDMAKRVREALGETRTEMARLADAETVTAASLDALGAYAHAQELTLSNRVVEALHEYERAVSLDPNFGRAYAGMAVIYANYYKQADKTEEYYQAALKHVDRMTEREKYRTLGTYYLNVAHNYEKAIENYEQLVKLYPADDGGHGNLALAYIHVGNLKGAVAEVRKSLEIYPRNYVQRYNYAMYSMYVGDFATAITEGTRLEKENPSFEYALLPLALSHLAQGHRSEAADAYERLSRLSPLGASLAGLGQADALMFAADYPAAIARLNEGIAVDRTAKSTLNLARKLVAMSEAYLASGQVKRAADSAAQAIALSRAESTLIPAARVLLRAGREPQALAVAAELDQTLQRHAMAYAQLILADSAAAHGRTSEAIDMLRQSQKRHDSWWSRFLLGKLYVEAGHYPEAMAELEVCVKRAGETTDIFIDDLPTLRYLPPAYYWLARAQEGALVLNEARRNYEAYINFRAEASPPDPIVADARERLAAMQ